MRIHNGFLVGVSVLAVLAGFAAADAPSWPAFRGRDGQGTAPAAGTILSCDAATGEGVRWSVAVPLPGTGSPIVSEDRVFLSGADETKAAVFCFDAGSGKLLWTGAVPAGGKPSDLNEDTTLAAPTPVTDGKRVFALFAGGTVAAFDLDGKPTWTASLGVPEMHYGYASSPVLHGGLLLVQYDQDGEGAALVALDAGTGKEAWRAKRSMGASWCSPVVVAAPRGPQVVLASCGGLAGHDPKDGKEIWTLKEQVGDAANTPVAAGNLLVATMGFGGTIAVRLDGAGEVTATHLAWRNDGAGTDVASPVAGGGFVFVPSSPLQCLDAARGTKLGEREIEGQYYASPVLVGDRLYCVNREGLLTVLKADPSLAVLGKGSLGERVDASPAVAGDRLYIRTAKRLACLAPAAPASAPVRTEGTPAGNAARP